MAGRCVGSNITSSADLASVCHSIGMRPWLIGIGVFLSVLILGDYIVGPPRCRSGWQSPSIGLRGACSHHGGVDRSRGGILGFIAVVSGIVAAVVFQEKGSAAAIVSNLTKRKSKFPSSAEGEEFLLRLRTLSENQNALTDGLVRKLVDESLLAAWKQTRKDPLSHLADLDLLINTKKGTLRPETCKVALDHILARRDWIQKQLS
jgi:hypothetical protein